MKLEDIQELWETDSGIDRLELADESLKIPKLHSKYHKIYTSERLLLRKFETDLKRLKLDKHEFYTQGPSAESKEKGWQFPARGLILKSDVSMYMDADPDLIQLSLKIGLQQEKCDFLESILRVINNRNYTLKNAIDYLKWTQGAG